MKQIMSVMLSIIRYMNMVVCGLFLVKHHYSGILMFMSGPLINKNTLIRYFSKP